MRERNNSDRRDDDRRVQTSPIDVERRVSERRSGIDRRAMLSGQPA